MPCGKLGYLCAFYQYKAHARLRVQRASGVPHALYRARDFMQGLGRFAPRGRERVFGVEMSTLVMPGQVLTETDIC